MPDTVVVDYGSGNIRSMLNALKVVSPAGSVEVSSDPAVVASAKRLVLPGVGAFGECRRKLDAAGLASVVVDAVKGGRPLLGVCVGMQVLADEGTEFGRHEGLGVLPGIVVRLEAPQQKLPHVGWTPVDHRGGPLFEGLASGTHFYFVHSFGLRCSDEANVAATATYGSPFTAAAQKGNVAGCQFHPEKSDRAGLKLLENFCRWNP